MRHPHFLIYSTLLHLVVVPVFGSATPVPDAQPPDSAEPASPEQTTPHPQNLPGEHPETSADHPSRPSVPHGMHPELPPLAGHAMYRGLRFSRVAGGEMSRIGSGTSWLPESSPMWMKVHRWGDWLLMQHGNSMRIYSAQGGPRGVSRLVGTNWYMAMGARQLGRGDLMLRAMLSLEPATVGNNGVPQLFQTGEGLIDRQHPHDLFMELAAQYHHPFSERLGAYLYLAPVGEPALGPPAYMHRASAWDIPTAPLSHHWTDSTHISYGVATAGLRSRAWKLEGSWFNGHEPDSNRWAIDPIRFNSYSGRLSYAANPNWVFQASRGRLDNPEINFPGRHSGDVRRTTFSAVHNRPLRRGNHAVAFVWGRNERDHGGTSDAFLLESTYQWSDRNYLLARVERVDKDELFPPSDPRFDRQFTIHAFSLGYARGIVRRGDFETAIGAMATVYAKPDSLDRVYGDFPVGVQIFMRVRPRQMRHSSGHQQHSGSRSPTPARLRTLLVAGWRSRTGEAAPAEVEARASGELSDSANEPAGGCGAGCGGPEP